MMGLPLERSYTRGDMHERADMQVEREEIYESREE
jgi:hypothetical protein